MNSRGFVIGSARSFFAACFLVLVTGIAALGQAGRGKISGTVSDTTGAVIPGAQVELLDRATGVKQHTTASTAGLYTFISLNPGVYEVTASHTGFASAAVDNVNVNVDQTTQANIQLHVGAVTESVTVTQGVNLVEPTSSTVGTLITAETIDRVPLLYRNVYDLVQLSAGVIPVNGSPNSSDSMQSIQNISNGDPGVDVAADTINGAIEGSVYYMVDGSPIGIAETSPAAIVPAMNIPEDAVQEVRVETQNTPASYASGGAGVISLVTKSGTNRFHGDVFGVFRPNALSANEYFNKNTQLSSGLANSPPPFHRYQEGGAIGGPIKKDKLFFFGDYEDTQQVQFEGVDYFDVPTAAERTGDFSKMSFPIYDPTRPDNPDGTRQPFPGNKIPNPNAIALLFLKNMPLCNLPDPVSCENATSDTPSNVPGNFGIPGLDPYKAHRFDIRVDWAKSERQRIFTRFSYDHLSFAQANVFPPPGWDPNYAQNTTNGRNVLVADDLTLNSTTVLNLRYSFARRYQIQGGPSSYSSINLTTLGFPSSLAAQQAFKQLPIMSFNDLSASSGVEGVGGTANDNIYVNASENSDVNATLTKVHGKHEISLGFEWMKRYENVGQPGEPAGAYSFDISATDQSVNSALGGSDYASFLLGMGTFPGTESANFSRDVLLAESNPYYASFVEDTYHASKTLTITAGLRWDIFGGDNERRNRLEYFDPTAANTVNGVSYTGAEVYVNGGKRSPFTTNMKDFGPRLGFAWQPVQHFVVRGGAGFYYGPSTHNVASVFTDSDGFSSVTPWNATCLNSDGNTVFFGSSCNANTGSALDVFTGPYSLSNPFPNGLNPIFTSAPPGLGNNLGIQLATVLHSQRTPTTYNFNFGIEYELPHQVVASVAYVGSRGLFLPMSSVDLNDLGIATVEKYQSALTALCPAPSCVPNKWNPILPPTNANYGAPAVPLFVALEPYPQFGTGNYGDGNGVIAVGYGGGDSEYSSLQAKLQKRLTGHFTTLATFTWGKIITDDGGPPLGFVGFHNGSTQDWRDLGLDHSVSPQDVKYQFSGTVSYDLPVGKGLAMNLNGVPNAILGGWTANGILYLGTGVPINSPSSGEPGTLYNQRSDLTCDPSRDAPHTPTTWFSYQCFARPGTENGGGINPFIPGNAPNYLDHVRTRGAREFDMSIYKTFKFTETKALRFDISAYNLSNTPQFGYPIVADMTSVFNALQQTPNNPSPASFGEITNTLNTPRQFQFGARFTF
jgi:Carboxypeptidase regulatory-like domain